MLRACRGIDAAISFGAVPAPAGWASMCRQDRRGLLHLRPELGRRWFVPPRVSPHRGAAARPPSEVAASAITGKLAERPPKSQRSACGLAHSWRAPGVKPNSAACSLTARRTGAASRPRLVIQELISCGLLTRAQRPEPATGSRMFAHARERWALMSVVSGGGPTQAGQIPRQITAPG
jgi:hypothetical protein